MLNFPQRRIFLATEPTDMRKSYDTLAALVKQNFHENPYSGDVFVFVGKRKNRLKILVWEDSGFWIFAKRLEVGTFPLPKKEDNSPVLLSPSDFQLLLEGIIILKSKKLKRFPGLKKT